MFGWLKDARASRLQQMVEDAVERILTRLAGNMESELAKFAEVDALTARIAVLREEKAEAEADLIRQKAEWAERERTIEHKTGLLKQQHEQELELAKKQAVLDAEQKVHEVKSAEFEQRQKLVQAQLEDTQKLMREVLDRLPDARMSFSRKEKTGE